MSLVVIVGETVSGKSNLAFKLARKINGEIICADSTTVRKNLNIGTAKPTTEEREKIKHHLIDLIEPTEHFTVVDFQKLAIQTIDDVSLKNKVPILVGGSGLYINSVIYNYNFDNNYNEVFHKKLIGSSLETLQKLAIQRKLDITKIDFLNSRRLITFIENNGNFSNKSSLLPNTIVIGIKINREELIKRVIKRIDKMLSDGLEKEVKYLKFCLGDDFNKINIIGYKEWQEYLVSKENIKTVRSKIISHTLQLAKKQRTWFHQNKDIIWLDNNVSLDKVVDLITTTLNNKI